MKITLHNPPAGYHAEAEFREPLSGEIFIDRYGLVCCSKDDTITYPRIILKKQYEWPSWCKAWGWCMDRNGSIYLHTSESSIDHTSGLWRTNSKFGTATYKGIIQKLFDIPTPVITDWTQPILNPNWKAE
jgi:hypothetical protein